MCVWYVRSDAWGGAYFQTEMATNRQPRAQHLQREFKNGSSNNQKRRPWFEVDAQGNNGVPRGLRTRAAPHGTSCKRTVYAASQLPASTAACPHQQLDSLSSGWACCPTQRLGSCGLGDERGGRPVSVHGRWGGWRRLLLLLAGRLGGLGAWHGDGGQQPAAAPQGGVDGLVQQHAVHGAWG
jgi:hypothetical protein